MYLSLWIQSLFYGSLITWLRRLLTNAWVAWWPWLGDADLSEEYLELGVEEGDIFATENFGHKGAALCQDMCGDVEGSKQQLGLHILIQVMQACYCVGEELKKVRRLL